MLDRLQVESDQLLWVLAWGGTNVLAQVLYKIHETHSEFDAAAIRAKVRVYAVSDQDDTGARMRQQYPDSFYISPTHGWNQYGLVAWIGISSEDYDGIDEGEPELSRITHKWLRDKIQVGPYGKTAYPGTSVHHGGGHSDFLVSHLKWTRVSQES